MLNAADIVLDRAMAWTPVDTGKLRRSLEKKVEGKSKVFLVAGKGIDYAREQYFDPLKHRLSGGKPMRILDGFAGATGLIQEERYWAAHKQLKEKGELKRVSIFDGKQSPQWFNRVLGDKKTRALMREVLINTINNGT